MSILLFYVTFAYCNRWNKRLRIVDTHISYWQTNTLLLNFDVSILTFHADTICQRKKSLPFQERMFQRKPHQAETTVKGMIHQLFQAIYTGMGVI